MADPLERREAERFIKETLKLGGQSCFFAIVMMSKCGVYNDSDGRTSNNGEHVDSWKCNLR